MLNFNGIPYSFVPGRNVPNKEPPTNRFVVEKLYRVHRQRMQKMEPIVDCYVEIPDFLTNNDWKLQGQMHKRQEIARENEVIYKRIAKAERTESLITKETREHAKHVENELKLMKRLKQMGRIRDILKTQRENEDMLRRIDKARPEYGQKSIKEWYKHHELFKKGRKSDPTAGHLGFRNMRGLMPKPLPSMELPPLDSPTKSFVSRGDKDRGNSPPHFSLLSDPLSMTMDGDEDMTIDTMVLRKMEKNATLYGSHSPGMSPANMGVGASQSLQSIDEKSKASTKGGRKSLKGAKGSKGSKGSKSAKSAKGPDARDTIGVATLSGSRPNSSTRGTILKPNTRQDTPKSTIGLDGQDSVQSNMERIKMRDAALQDPDFTTIMVVEKPIPFHVNHCLLQFMVKPGNAQTLFIHVRRAVEPYEICSTRETPLDKVYDMVSTRGTAAIFSDSTMISDLSTMRQSFIQMFHEVDADGNGYLTFDEFLTLMESCKLGLDESELRRILQAADENDNGVVEEEEFYPLILDLVLAFRTFNAAKQITRKKIEILEEEASIRVAANGDELEAEADSLLMKVASFDSKMTGFVRHNDLKKALSTMAPSLGLSTLDCALILRSMPASGGFARLNYATIPESFKSVKCMTCCYKLQEDLGSPVYLHLLKKCIEEDKKNPSDWDHGAITGQQLVDIIKHDSKFQLNTIQLIVLCSAIKSMTEAIPYRDVLPVIAKAVELMLDPAMLQQRAELLMNDSIMDTIADGKDADKSVSRLQKLFNVSDANDDKTLNHVEFGYCIKSLGLKFNDEEILALFAQADPHNNGYLTFMEFAKFFEKNLATLERQMHMKEVYNMLHDNTKTVAAVGGELERASQLKDLESHLEYVFVAKAKELTETTGTNTNSTAAGRDATPDRLTRDAVMEVLSTIDVVLTPFQLSSIMGELFLDADGYVNIKDATVVSAHLLQVFLAEEEVDREEAAASHQAKVIVTKSEHEIHRVVDFFMHGINIIEHNKGISVEEREKAIETLVRSPHSGLNPTEGNLLMHTIFNHLWYRKHKKRGDFGYERLLSTNLQVGRDAENARAKYHQQRKASIRTMSKVNRFSGSFEDGATMDTGVVNSNKSQRSSRLSIRGSSDTPPALEKWAPTAQELTDAVCDVKKQSCMRNIIQTVSAPSVTSMLMKSFETAKEIAVMQKKLPKLSIYLPVRMIFEILEDCLTFRLSRPQLMALIAFSPNFDRTETRIDYKAFSTYAGEWIAKTLSSKSQEQRANILDMISSEFHASKTLTDHVSKREGSSLLQHETSSALMADNIAGEETKATESMRTAFQNFVINGVTEPELDKNLIDEMLLAEDNRGEVTEEDFIRILTSVPNVVITARDAAALIGAFPHTESGNIHWQEFIPYAHSSISSLAIEHMVKRRLDFLTFESNPEALAPAAADGTKGGKDALAGKSNTDHAGNSELIKVLAETAELVRIRAYTEAAVESESIAAAGSSSSSSNSVGGGDTTVGGERASHMVEKLALLFPYDEDANAAPNLHEHDGDESIASLDTMGNDQGLNGTETELFSGFVSVDCHMVEPPKPQKKAPLTRAGSSFIGTPNRTPVGGRKGLMAPSSPTTDSKVLPVQIPIFVCVVAVEKSMGLDRDLRVTVQGKFNYDQQRVVNDDAPEGGEPFVVVLEDALAMPSMCLIDTESAIEFAESIPEKIMVHFVEKCKGLPKVLVKPTQHPH